MRVTYNPNTWFWIGQPSGQTSEVIYSSASGKLVPSTDAGYQDFIKNGKASPWPVDDDREATYAALDAVLSAAGLPKSGLANPTTVELQAHLNTVLTSVLSGEITINIGTAKKPTTLFVDVSPSGRTDVYGIQVKVSGGATSVIWRQSTGAITLTVDQFATVANDVTDYVEKAYDTWQKISDDLNSSTPTIVSTTLIDSPPSSIPTWPSREY